MISCPVEGCQAWTAGVVSFRGVEDSFIRKPSVRVSGRRRVVGATRQAIEGRSRCETRMIAMAGSSWAATMLRSWPPAPAANESVDWGQIYDTWQDGFPDSQVQPRTPPAVLGDYVPANAPCDPELVSRAGGNVVSHYHDLEGRPVGCPDQKRLLAASCEQLKAAELVVGVAAGVDNARDIVGAARAGPVDAIVTGAITAQAVLALLDTPDGATGEPPRPVAEGP
jgi:hypothetical protein